MRRQSLIAAVITALMVLALVGAASASGIHVTQAKYGARGQWRDCTTVLQSRCDGSPQCSLNVDNDIVGDPYPGVGKSLVVTFECADGRSMEIQAEEGQLLNLSCDRPAGRTDALAILAAGYGSGGRWMDCTDRIRTSCQGRTTCAVRADNDFIGQDPYPGRTKQLVVEYQCGSGARTSRSVEEGQWLKLGCEDQAPPSRELTVVEARYGAQGRYRDCTSQVREMCRGRSSCSVLSSNDLVGDPFPGAGKELVITYRCNNRQMVVRAEEGRWADVGCAASSQPGPAPAPGEGESGGLDSVPVFTPPKVVEPKETKPGGAFSGGGAYGGASTGIQGGSSSGGSGGGG